jgi:hypothetical protein
MTPIADHGVGLPGMVQLTLSRRLFPVAMISRARATG